MFLVISIKFRKKNQEYIDLIGYHSKKFIGSIKIIIVINKNNFKGSRTFKILI